MMKILNLFLKNQPFNYQVVIYKALINEKILMNQQIFNSKMKKLIVKINSK